MSTCKEIPVKLIPVKKIAKRLPLQPRQGDSYLIADEIEGEGVLIGRERNIAVYGMDNCSEWCFFPPCPGMYVFVNYPGTGDTDPGNVRVYQYDQLNGWVPLTASLYIS